MTEETKGRETVYVNEFTDGVLDPEKPMLGPVKDGGHIIANTAPGCWGPMITPELRGGHEVTIPVAVEGAEVGDAIAIRIKEISVTSIATSSGNDYWVDGLYMGDPYVAKYDPDNEELNPESYVEGEERTQSNSSPLGSQRAHSSSLTDTQSHSTTTEALE